MFRLGAVGAAMAALLAAGAASATASTSMAPSLRMRALAVERAHLVPHGFFFSFTTVALQTTPVDVVRNGVTYSMSMTVYQDTGSGGTLQLRLSRVAPDGRAFQSHSYGFSPQSGIHLTYDKKTLQTAALDTTTAITPSQVTGAFTATSVKSKTCRLYDGRMGTKRVATGTLSWSAFDVVTSTAPFFGTIHTQPATAKIIKDPGCSQGVVVFSSAANAVRAIPKIGPAIVTSAPHERYVQPCFFNRALGAKVGPGRFFGFEKAYRYPQIFQYALRASQVPPDERRIPRHRGPGREVEPPEARQGWRRPLRGVDLGVGRRVHDRLGDVHVRPTRDSDGPLLPGWRPDAALRPPHVPRNARARRVEPARRGVRHPAARASRGHAGHVHRARLRPPGLETPYRIPGGRSPRRVSTF